MIDRLRDDLKAAMKGGDKVAVRVLRMLLSEIHNHEIASGGALGDDELVRVLRKAVKQRVEAAEQFQRGGRPERAADERAEIEVVERYLPDLLGDEELDRAVDEAIEATGATTPADRGRVMGELMERHGARVDGRVASQRVRERLSG